MSETPRARYVITDLTIDDAVVVMSGRHPERTPIGPFPSKQAAWDHAHYLQTRYGRGGGSVSVSELHAPEDEAAQ